MATRIWDACFLMMLYEPIVNAAEDSRQCWIRATTILVLQIGVEMSFIEYERKMLEYAKKVGRTDIDHGALTQCLHNFTGERGIPDGRKPHTKEAWLSVYERVRPYDKTN